MHIALYCWWEMWYRSIRSLERWWLACVWEHLQNGRRALWYRTVADFWAGKSSFSDSGSHWLERCRCLRGSCWTMSQTSRYRGSVETGNVLLLWKKSVQEEGGLCRMHCLNFRWPNRFHNISYISCRMDLNTWHYMGLESCFWCGNGWSWDSFTQCGNATVCES